MKLRASIQSKLLYTDEELMSDLEEICKSHAWHPVYAGLLYMLKRFTSERRWLDSRKFPIIGLPQQFIRYLSLVFALLTLFRLTHCSILTMSKPAVATPQKENESLRCKIAALKTESSGIAKVAPA